jgi:hypothetical protein
LTQCQPNDRENIAKPDNRENRLKPADAVVGERLRVLRRTRGNVTGETSPMAMSRIAFALAPTIKYHSVRRVFDTEHNALALQGANATGRVLEGFMILVLIAGANPGAGPQGRHLISIRKSGGTLGMAP